MGGNTTTKIHSSCTPITTKSLTGFLISHQHIHVATKINVMFCLVKGGGSNFPFFFYTSGAVFAPAEMNWASRRMHNTHKKSIIFICTIWVDIGASVDS